jgi:cytochrome c oxidase assembly protein subunit 15
MPAPLHWDDCYRIPMLRLRRSAEKRRQEVEPGAPSVDCRKVLEFDAVIQGRVFAAPPTSIASQPRAGTELRYSRQPVRDGTYDPLLHLLALLIALATFPLIFMGGLVTSHHAGMSVPDWPNSYHYNMFLFPPRLWIGGILYEHTHRLMGSVVGFLSLCLAGWAWRRELLGRPRLEKSERSVQVLALAVLGGVIFQGALGGLRVVLVNLDLAILHACVAQAFFCLAVLTALASSRWWISASRATMMFPAARRFISFTGVCVLAIYLQLIVGATMRHHDAGLAIPDLPLSYGKLLPPVTAEQLQAANHLRAWDLNLDPVTLGQIWLHFAHRIGAVIVTALLLVLIISVLRHHRGGPLPGLAIILGVLLLAQLTLGVLTVIFRKPADVASAHVAVGALVLATTFGMLVCAMRMYAPRGAWRALVVACF